MSVRRVNELRNHVSVLHPKGPKMSYGATAKYMKKSKTFK